VARVGAAISRLRAVPRPLAVLLAIATVELLAWSIVVPALQEPDEASHFSYVQAIVERHEVPWASAGGPRDDLARFSPEQRVASVWAGLEPLRANLAARPLWTSADERVWSAHDRALGRGAKSAIQPSSAFENPPLAYLYEAVPYAVVRGSFFDRLFAMRWANLPLLLITVAATWLAAVEVFGSRRSAAFLATAVVALQPLLTSVAGGVAPDLMLSALFAVGIAVALRLVARGMSASRLVTLALVSVAAPLTQPRGLALALPALLAVGLAWWRARGGASSPGPRRALAVAVGALVVVGAGVALRYAERGGPTLSGTRAFLSYLWQFYLPKLPGMAPPPFPGWGVRDVYVDRLYGTFGQLEITLPGGVIDAVALAGLAFVVVGVVAAVVHRRALLSAWPSIAILLAAFLGALLLVHLQAFRDLRVDPADPVITGRYLLPVLPVLGIAVAGALRALPTRLFAAAGGVTIAGGVLLQLAALAVTITRFYA
jgi:hypothetical protein